MSLSLRRGKIKVISKKWMIRFLFALPKLGWSRQIDVSEHGAHLYCFGMLLPHRVSQHLHHHGTKWFVFCFSHHIEQGCETQPCRPPTHLGSSNSVWPSG